MRRLNRNPRDESLLKRIIVTKKYDVPGYPGIWYTAYLDKEAKENLVGEIYYSEGKENITDAFIKEEYQKMGVGTYLYDLIEKDYNIKLKPSARISQKAQKFWANRLKKNPMKTRSKISKRKSSCKCRSPRSSRKCSCPRRKNPLDGKIPTREFRNLNPDKYYIFHLYGNVSQWGKPVLSDPKRFIVESNSERTIHFWEDLLNVYGPFTSSKQAIDAWKKLLNEGYL